jgi:hypothetical protein
MQLCFWIDRWSHWKVIMCEGERKSSETCWKESERALYTMLSCAVRAMAEAEER